MPFYNPITNASELPAPGEVIERDTLDFKVTYSPTNGEEMAKDIAAMSNHLGGVLLIGATETVDGRLAEYKPLPRELAGKLKAAFENAARNQCSPTPLVFVQVIDHGSGVLLAVNIEPTTHTLVGVHYGRDAYHFPLRRGSTTIPLKPEMLPMYMLSEVRRTAILLERVRDHHNIRVAYWSNQIFYNWPNLINVGEISIRIQAFSAEDNYVEFEARYQDKTERAWASLEAIASVSIRSEEGQPFEKAMVDIQLKPNHHLRYP